MTPYAAYVKNKGKKSKVKIALDTGKDESGRDTSKKIKVKFNPKKNKLVKKVISTKKAKRNKDLEIVEPWERTKTKTVKYLGSDKKDKVKKSIVSGMTSEEIKKSKEKSKNYSTKTTSPKENKINPSTASAYSTNTSPATKPTTTNRTSKTMK